MTPEILELFSKSVDASRGCYEDCVAQKVREELVAARGYVDADRFDDFVDNEIEEPTDKEIKACLESSEFQQLVKETEVELSEGNKVVWSELSDFTKLSEWYADSLRQAEESRAEYVADLVVQEFIKQKIASKPANDFKSYHKSSVMDIFYKAETWGVRA